MDRTVYVHLGYGFGVAGYRERFRQGLVPDEVPYGIHHAEQMGWRVAYSRDRPESGVWRFVRRALNSVLGFDLLHAWRNRKLMRMADIVWTMEERQGLAVLCLGFVLRCPPVILQIIWLFDRWNGFSGPRKAFLRLLLCRAAQVTVHSGNYVTRARELGTGVEPVLLRFGISTETFPAHAGARAGHRPIRVLAMGSDPTRDWETFLKAFGLIDLFQVVAISPALTAERLAGLSNVEVPVMPSMAQFAEFYRWADVVVIPMRRNLYSGITVALEAVRQGVPVVCSRTGGVPTYLAEDEAIYVEPGDPAALREAVLGCSEAVRAAVVERAQRRFQAEDYTTRGMAMRYVRLSEALLSEEPVYHEPQ